MPESGAEWRPPGELLSFEELLRCCRIMAGLGIRKVKLSGGEPLLRRGLAALIAALKAAPGIEQVTLTTNGLLLERELEGLALAGLDGVNISLDTLDGETFRRLTRWPGGPDALDSWGGRGGPRSGVDQVIRAVDMACAAGLPVKINCVLLRGINDHEAADIAALARDRPLALRFIELMPLGIAGAFEPLTGQETAALLEGRYGKLAPLGGRLGNGPAEYLRPEGFTGAVGFINPLSRGFCGSCNRLRLNALGFLRPCLSSNLGLDLKTPLRGGAADTDLEAAIRGIVRRKPAGHRFSEAPGQRGAEGPPLEMFRIGG
jgi:cyclic pyranopterin phosphate synthase